MIFLQYSKCGSGLTGNISKDKYRIDCIKEGVVMICSTGKGYKGNTKEQVPIFESKSDRVTALGFKPKTFPTLVSGCSIALSYVQLTLLSSMRFSMLLIAFPVVLHLVWN